MDHDLICSWLGLPSGTWPPDHYRLLGLELGEDNAEVIEQRVHERLDTVRRYQMMHPEQATEAMNRLAQAFVCLTDASAKKTYDAQLGLAPAAAQAAVVSVPPAQAAQVEWLPSTAPLAWPTDKAPAVAEGPPPRAIPAVPPPLPATVLNPGNSAPPPLRQPPPLPDLMPSVASTPPPPAIPAIPLAIPVPREPPAEPIDPLVEAAQSATARRGIATKRALYKRIASTRRLLRVWNELGKYLSSPKRRLNRSAEGPELVRLLEQFTTLLKGFPPLLGEAGQPGYLILALTQVDTVKVFQSFSPHQRETLSRDWGAALKLLTAHRDFLRRELRVMRQRPFRQRLVRASWSFLVERPGTIPLLLALLALFVALCRTYADELAWLFVR